jgi:hypothetical protein
MVIFTARFWFILGQLVYIWLEIWTIIYWSIILSMLYKGQSVGCCNIWSRERDVCSAFVTVPAYVLTQSHVPSLAFAPDKMAAIMLLWGHSLSKRQSSAAASCSYYLHGPGFFRIQTRGPGESCHIATEQQQEEELQIFLSVCVSSLDSF